MAEIFYGFELLLFKKFSAYPEEWLDLKRRLLEKVGENGTDIPSPEDLGIFDCPSIKFLSLKYNCLDSLPADIGRMKRLEYLALTNNKLQVQSLPYTLTFCKKLRTLLLDNNLLDALPGFLLKMSTIKTVHRHGNHNYFKSTFMWYHTDVDYRIIPVWANSSPPLKNPHSLQFWAAKTLIGLKVDFYSDPSVAVCAKALEVPARMEQIAAAKRLDEQYEEYVLECQKMFQSVNSTSTICSCVSTTQTDEITESEESLTSRCIIS
ncbi:hypothetical protein KUTeg_013866 [Tegillarca granosa]|uniref:Uncharacterized protein n=1 Tax=Tegillarca granosa TaxID=220873 RepID=A0ABQ9EUX9_TEGGR|nr:hypothetical protein KUTeg_013866 [Tegillarca granosa]